MKEICPICGLEDEDMRHLSVECFYNIKEIVPDMEEKTVLQEVKKTGTYWGITRTYPRGTRDRHYFKKTGEHRTEMTIKQVPSKGTRFLETTVFTINCCKSCRADFLTMLKDWRKGKFLTPEGDGDIPIRVNGAIKMITKEEWENRHEKI